jgi:large subunit ribosomal protein L21
MDYAIIRLGGKQYRVREGETLVVDRLKTDEGKTFQPDVLLGEGTVTATVLAHERGPKIRIGKLKRRTGYRKHTGFRASLTQIQIESIGGGAKKASAKPKAEKAEAPAKAEQAAAPKAEKTEKVEAPARTAHPPKGYEDMTVAEISENVSGWRRPNIEAALEYEKANANRKGAIATLESALSEKESH